MTAVGTHDHPTRKLGRRPPSNKPALMLGDVLAQKAPSHPISVDHLIDVTFGLDRNDEFGVCGPTSCDNYVRLVSSKLLGKVISFTQDQVFDLYRLSGNPDFDPNTGVDDNGVDMQTMLEAWLKHGAGEDEAGQPIKPVAFAKVDVNDDDELEAAIAIFGGLLWGVDLEIAQQAQSDATPIVWDYAASADWGGHAVVTGAYGDYGAGGSVSGISWAEQFRSLPEFRRRQLQEAWVVILPWHLEHPAFLAGVDKNALAGAFHALTGKTLKT